MRKGWLMTLVLGALALPIGCSCGQSAENAANLEKLKASVEKRKAEEEAKAKADALAAKATPTVVPPTPDAQPVAKPIERPKPADPRQTSLDNMAAIARAVDAYVGAKGSYPPSAIYGANGEALLGWRVLLLPYLGEEELFKKFRLNERFNSKHNLPLMELIPAVYQVPERPDVRTPYLFPVGKGTLFSSMEGTPVSQVLDGVENTLLLIEVPEELRIAWTRPIDYSFSTSDPVGILNTHREEGFFVSWANGRIAKIPREVTGFHLLPAFTMAGREDFQASDISLAPEVMINGSAKSKLKLKPLPGTEEENNSAPAAAQTQLTDDDEQAGSTAAPQNKQRTPVAVAKGQYGELAKRALGERRERDAMQFFYAWALTAQESEGGWLKHMHWAPSLQRPVLMVRWGLGVTYVGPANLSDPAPIKADERARSSRGGENSLLSTLTGEIGDKVLDEIEVRTLEGNWGELLADHETSARGRTRPVARADRSKGNRPTLIGPGVTFLGVGSRRDLLQLAQQETVDVLLIFEVNAKPVKSSLTINNTSLALVDVQRGRDLHSSATLNNIRVWKSRENALEEDPVDAVIGKLFAAVDDGLLVTELPEQIRPEHAAKRVETLSQASHDNPLPALTEMRFYHARELIDDETLLKGYMAALGEEEGRMLFDPGVQDRAKVLMKFLPKADQRSAVVQVTNDE